MRYFLLVWCGVVLFATSCATSDGSGTADSSPNDLSANADTAIVSSDSGLNENLDSTEPYPAQQGANDDLDVVVVEGNKDGSASFPAAEQPSPQVRERLIEAIATDLAQPKENLAIDSITAQTWSDGCLGLAARDEFCSMALVEGWQIGLKVGDTMTVYRSNAEGTDIRRAN
ncbi:MAG: hypothetical protein F6K65_40900 [Moorea sp. SIO3C2]|nr:hypothetical protein [Moorena sp. SIO3C2]